MLKYDHQLTEVKTRLPSANRILIVLPQNLNVDNLSAGLSLYLSLKAAGKKVDIVSTGTPQVAQSNLYGIGDIKTDISKAGAGNFVISLDGVVDTTGTMQQIPALEKLDWYPEGSKLNLVFHVVPGQRFEPTNITTKHEESGYDLTWVIGCQSLNELGNLFISNSQYFAQSQVINVDINPLNSYFGFANVIDPQASSLSEIIAHVLPSLTLSTDLDTASNILAGIYAATNNLTQKINPDTFMAVSQAVQSGGVLPGMQVASAQPMPQPDTKIDYQPQPEVFAQPQMPVQQPVSQAPVFNSTPVVNQAPDNGNAALQSSPFIVPPQDIFIPAPTVQPQMPTQPDPMQPQSQFQFNQPTFDQGNAASQPVINPIQSAQPFPQGNNEGFDLRQIFQIPQMPSGATPNPSNAPAPVQQPAPQPQPIGGNPEKGYDTPPQAQASAEERPMGEFANSPSPDIESTPTPDWLVPKIFKGGNLG